jgi:hypothetical protein
MTRIALAYVHRNRAQPGIVVSGERMVVVGGYTDPVGEPTAETWGHRN